MELLMDSIWINLGKVETSLKAEVGTSVGTWDDGTLTEFISLILNFLVQYFGL